ncbi:MAG: hypothetical protein EB111_04725, partial [Actinobacteria bacterium]|nr:hypothetical protein [Actinomycetota bacterium]
ADKEIDNTDVVQHDLVEAATASWASAVRDGEEYGVRNSQASVLAPTGTIGLMMDCDTTGIEPDLGLVKFKKLVGGGNMTIVNQTVPRALKKLGYEKPVVDRIVEYIDKNKTIVGSRCRADGRGGCSPRSSRSDNQRYRRGFPVR